MYFIVLEKRILNLFILSSTVVEEEEKDAETETVI